MCIIVVKEKGVNLPSRDILKRCYERNPDGCGFMYYDKNKVIIEKGYKVFDEFYEKVREIDERINLKNRSCVFHFRIKTAGATDEGNCHPFPISDDKNKLKEKYIETDMGVAHNGTIVKFVQKNSSISDTMWFIKEFLYPFYNYNKKFIQNRKIQDVIEVITNSKFAFLDKSGNIYTIGNFIEEDNGLLFSNLSYKGIRGQLQWHWYDNEKYENVCR